jgi:Domain of Unknown Function (DUF930)
MRAFGVAIGAALLLVAPAANAESRIDRALKMLAPSERIEQLCDYTAMAHIRKDGRPFRPDRAVASATAEARIHNDTIEAKGGAFRSRGKWYALSFVCKTTPDHMTVVKFNYTIGAEIPETKWASDGLWQ